MLDKLYIMQLSFAQEVLFISGEKIRTLIKSSTPQKSNGTPLKYAITNNDFLK